jgi:membrane protein insertase Oxa1/YidC/SpoIIIJ
MKWTYGGMAFFILILILNSLLIEVHSNTISKRQKIKKLKRKIKKFRIKLSIEREKNQELLKEIKKCKQFAKDPISTNHKHLRKDIKK